MKGIQEPKLPSKFMMKFIQVLYIYDSDGCMHAHKCWLNIKKPLEATFNMHVDCAFAIPCFANHVGLIHSSTSFSI
jgi:hypothetical protein